jgi:hypothetical protein
MQRNAIRTGVVYAYRNNGMHPCSSTVPLVFLKTGEKTGLDPVLWHEVNQAMGYRGPAFLPAPRDIRPRVGLASNSGAIGYPAVLAEKQADEVFSELLSVTMDEFRLARTTCVINRPEQMKFLVVVNLARISPWWEG